MPPTLQAAHFVATFYSKYSIKNNIKLFYKVFFAGFGISHVKIEGAQEILVPSTSKVGPRGIPSDCRSMKSLRNAKAASGLRFPQSLETSCRQAE
jgi:hypothetical protein